MAREGVEDLRRETSAVSFRPELPRKESQASERIERMKKRLLSAPYEICLERARYFTEVYQETEGEHPAIRNAKALARTLKKQPVFIYGDELIAGSKTGKFLAGALPVERGDFLRVLQSDINFLERKYRPFKMSEEDKRYFLEVILPYWSGRTIRDMKARDWIRKGIIEPLRPHPLHMLKRLGNMIRFVRHMGKDSRRLGKVGSWSLRDEVSKNNPNMAIFCYDVQGHLCLGCDKVVKEGFSGIKKKAEQGLSNLRRDDPEYEEKSKFLEAVIISMDASMEYARRFAELAERMAGEEKDEERREELLRMSEGLKWSPANPSRTFYEGIQATWVALVIAEIHYGMHDVIAIGRTDQYLYRLYKKDIEEGRITEEGAMELIQELGLKLTANVSLFPEIGARANSALGVSQHCITIGGVDREGREATNELSYLMLKAYENMRGCINQLSVRFHKDTPNDFRELTSRVFRTASGIAMFNDEVIIPSLVETGCSLEDAREYTIVGCIETSPGSSSFVCAGGHEVVLPAILYMTMTNGRYPAPIFGQKRGISTGNPARFRSFDEFMDAFKRQLRHNISILIEAVESRDRAYSEALPCPYVSSFMDGCLENARDMTRGGAKYNFSCLIGRGLATAADSLLTIKKIVFEKKETTMKEMIEACMNNFRDNEPLRQRLLTKLPKYGNDEDEADEIARELVTVLHEESKRYRNIQGGRFRLGLYSYGNHVVDGFFLGATPDGRRRGEPLSNGISPTNRLGEKGGVTAVFKSVTKIGQGRAPNGLAFNVKIHPSNLAAQDGIKKFASLLSTYFELGGMHIQPNVVSNEMLREAQRNPDEYRDLIVKVAGYSAYFTDLGKSIQNDIIAREEL